MPSAGTDKRKGTGVGTGEGSKATQFGLGNQAARKSPPPARLEKADFDRLTSMRYILTNPKACDQTPAEKALRSWLDKSPGPFMEAYDRLEAEAKRAAAGERVAEAGEGEEIEPTETDEELADEIDALIARHKAKGKK